MPMERFTRESLSHHDPEHHGDFLLEIFLLSQPQSAALEPGQQQQKEKLIQQSQTVCKRIMKGGQSLVMKTYRSCEHRYIL